MYAKYVALRDEQRLNDNQVAIAAGIERSTLADWKSGRSTPKLEKLAKISNVLGVPLEYWIEGETNES